MEHNYVKFYIILFELEIENIVVYLIILNIGCQVDFVILSCWLLWEYFSIKTRIPYLFNK